jgi:VWFA-related protein
MKGIALIVAGGLFAQAAGAQEPLGEFLDTVEVRVVNVDVVVTDRDGQPLLGLTREDFELLENGKPVTITHFAGPAPVETPEATVETEMAETAAPAAPMALTLAILMDDRGLRPAQRNQVLEQVRRFLAQSFRAGDRALVAAVDGSLRQVVGLTEDRARIDAALAELERSSSRGNSTTVRHAQLMREIHMLSAGDVRNADVARGLYSEIEAFRDVATAEASATLRAVAQLVESLASLGGHKVLFLAASGFSNRPAQDLFDAWERRSGLPAPGASPLTIAPQLEMDLRDLIARANSSRVTVYTVAAGDSGGGPRADEPGDSTRTAGGLGEALERESSLGRLAESTGGRRLISSPKLDDALVRLADELAGSYSLGYEPAAEGAPVHALEVRVRRPGARVRHRPSWRERTPSEQVSDATLAALLHEVAENPLEVVAEIGAGKAEGRRGERLVPLRLRIPLRHLALVPAGPAHHGKLAFFFARRDGAGRVAVFERRELALEIPNAELAEALRKLATYEVSFRFPAGAHRMAVAVHDELGNASSTLTLDIPANEG